MAGVVGLGLIITMVTGHWLGLIVTLPVAGVLAIFSSLTVTVDDGGVSHYFGANIWKRTYPITDIRAARRVKSPWYWGYGIRYYGKGWLYNLSGPHAVELDLAGEKQVRIGTDDPDGLYAAIETRLGG